MNLPITMDDSIPQQAGPVTPQQIVEAIAQQWDGCMTDIACVGEVDIGATIRSDGVPHQFRSSHLAAPLAVEDSRERCASSDAKRRTDADYAIEHAGYLATAAKHYINAINAEHVAQMDYDEDESLLAEEALNAAIESVGEASRNLRSCIYEFEKRRDRAAMAAASSGKEN